MVLRGAQFQRCGPAGCAFLTRRALSSYTADFLQERSDAGCLRHESRITHRCMGAVPRRRSVLATSRRTRVALRESVTYVMGILGDCH